MVKITLTNGAVYEGTVHAVDPVSKLILLRNTRCFLQLIYAYQSTINSFLYIYVGNNQTFQMIPPHSIASIDGDLPASLEGQPDISTITYVVCNLLQSLSI